MMVSCYHPDGSIAHDHTPCRSPSIGNGDGAVACCPHADICLDNHLCLAQTGPAVIYRGSCTDRKWESPDCAQYCSDGSDRPGNRDFNWKGLMLTLLLTVEVMGDAAIYFVDVEGHFLFCCGNMDPSSNTCVVGTKGSSSPFFVEAGLVIFNRTSGSTSTNNTDITSGNITVAENAARITATNTLTAATSASASPCMRLSSSSSSRIEIPLSAGASGVLGLALLFTLSLLWKQRKYKQILSKDIQRREEKYRDLMEIRTGDLEGTEQRQLEAWRSHEIDGQSRAPGQPFSGNPPDELDGTQIHEIADRR